MARSNRLDILERGQPNRKPSINLLDYAGKYGGYKQDEPADSLPVVLRQSRVESFVEAWINVAIGFGINFVANMLILPAFGFTTLTLGQNFIIGMIYTVISVGRSYVIRRWAQDNLRRLNTAVSVRIIKGYKWARSSLVWLSAS